MSETNTSTPGACGAFREELPLLAMGALDAERADLIRKHLSGCDGCRTGYASYCRVLETVKSESAPERLLNTEQVLARLRERMSKADGGAETGAGKGRPFKLFIAMALLAVGVIVLVVLTRPGNDPPPLELPEAPDTALVYTAKQPGGREVKSGTEVKAEKGGARVRFANVEIRLKKGGSLRVQENGIELLAGAVAVNVLSDASFTVSVPGAAARVVSRSEARFAVELDGPDRVVVTVAEGQLALEHAGGRTEIAAGQRGCANTKGLDGELVAADLRAAFGWLSEELYEGLRLELTVLRPTRVALRLKNTSGNPIAVTGYHPLGVNYQVEIRRPGSTSPEFVKCVPSSLRIRRAPGVIEAVRETLGQLILEPDQDFELEMDLAPMLTAPGTYRVAAAYLGFGPTGGNAAEQGLLLRSNEVRLVIAAPSPGGTKKK